MRSKKQILAIKNSPQWGASPAHFSLKEGEVHLWGASLSLPALALEGLQATLSVDEKERAARFVFVKDREHFVAARGILRDILSRYLHIPRKELIFCYGEHGKPALIDSMNPLSLQFNMSHSKNRALYAITLNTPIGVDMEALTDTVDVLGISKRFFAKNEFETLASLPAHRQQKQFFQYWTLKEAFVKAMGSGLFLSFDTFEVVSAPGVGGAHLRFLQERFGKISDWVLCPVDCSFALERPYVAALALRGAIHFLQCWSYPLTFLYH